MRYLHRTVTASQSSANHPKYIWMSQSLLHGVTDLIEIFIIVTSYLYYFPIGAAVYVTKLTKKSIN